MKSPGLSVHNAFKALPLALGVALCGVFLMAFLSVVPGDGRASCGVPPPNGSHGDLWDCKTYPAGDENHPDWCC
jgi:hypothetical protein